MPSAVAVDTLGLDSSSTAIAMGTFGPSSSSLAVVVDKEIPGSSFVTVAMEHIEVHQRPSIGVAALPVGAAFFKKPLSGTFSLMNFDTACSQNVLPHPAAPHKFK